MYEVKVWCCQRNWKQEFLWKVSEQMSHLEHCNLQLLQ